MMRFFWKKKSDSSGTEATKAKILRNVSFPLVFNVYDYCSDELKQTLNLGIEFQKKQHEIKIKDDADRFEKY